MTSRWLCVASVAAACGGGSNPSSPDAPTPDGPAASAIIGPAGGSVQGPNAVTVMIPPNALDADTTITISVSPKAAPDGSLTPLYDFAPHGLVFAQPATVTLPMPSGTSGASIYWSKHGFPGFDRIGGTPAGDTISAPITHFSSGYVAPTTGMRTVLGTQITTFVRPGGITNQATDLTAVPVVVYLLDGSFTKIPGLGNADGTFEVDNVPDGDYLLQLGTENYVTSVPVFDAGSELPGRADATVPTQATTINLNIVGLTSWASGDLLEAYSGEADAWYFNLEQVLSLGTGFTSVNGSFTSNDGIGSRQPPFDPSVHLVQKSKGDLFAVAQLTQQTAGSTPYLAMTKYFSYGLLDQTDGQSMNVSGAFTDVSAANSLSATIMATQFDGAAGWNGTNATAIHPNAVPIPGAAGTGLSVLGIPGGTGYGEYSNTADFLAVQLANGASDQLVSGMMYGTPQMGMWGVIGDVRDSFMVNVLATGSTTPARFQVSIGASDEIAHLTAAPITVELSEPRSPMIGSASAWSSPTGVGPTPTFSWQAPTTGTPKYYRIAIYDVANNSNGKTVKTYAGSIATAQTSVQLPPGMLIAGHQYVAYLNANDNANFDLSVPNRYRLPSHHAALLTSVFSP